MNESDNTLDIVLNNIVCAVMYGSEHEVPKNAILYMQQALATHTSLSRLMEFEVQKEIAKHEDQLRTDLEGFTNRYKYNSPNDTEHEGDNSED